MHLKEPDVPVVVSCQSLVETVNLINPIKKLHNMQVAVWGPVGWKFLHSVAHGFPEHPSKFDTENGLAIGTTANNYLQFFVLVGRVLPCRYCKDSYLEYLSEQPPATASKSTLTRWLWDIHNKVNQKLGVTYDGAGYDNVYHEYESFRAKCVDPASRGCTIPDAKHSRKKAVIVVQDVGTSRNTRTALLLVTVVLLILVFYLRSHGKA